MCRKLRAGPDRCAVCPVYYDGWKRPKSGFESINSFDRDDPVRSVVHQRLRSRCHPHAAAPC